MRTTPSPGSPEGPKRSNPYLDQNPAQRPRQDQVEMLKEWLVAVRDRPLRDHAAVEDFLGFVATGKQFPHDLATATFVFNELIRCEAYAAFVDVFAAYNQIQKSTAEADGTPFKSLLVLELPADWKPTAPIAMSRAFEQVRAQRVVVNPPPETEDDYFMVPEAVHDCLIALLEAGTTELVINGTIFEPDGLAEAFEESRLRSVEFGWVSSETPDEQDVASYAMLADGLAACKTLTHIGVNHAALLELHTSMGKFPFNGPPLETVGIALDSEHPIASAQHDDSIEIRAFMQAVGQVPSVTTVTANAMVSGGDNLKAAFIEPLIGHKALTRLEITGGLSLPVSQDTLETLPMVASMSVSCDSLTHFKWAEGTLTKTAGEAMSDFVRLAGGDLDMVMPSSALATALASPNFRLQSLTLNGLPFAPGILNALFAALKDNKTLKVLDLSSCYIDLASTAILMDALKTNTTLETILLPDQFDDYYLRTSDGRVHGFMHNDPDSEDSEDPPEGFELYFGDDVDQDARTLAFETFNPLKDHANGLFEALAARNRRAQSVATTASMAPSLQVASDVNERVLNAKNANGANALLWQANENDDVDAMKRWLAEGAIDHDGLVEAAARTAGASKALEAARNARSGATTTTTFTATTSTTSTTATTTTASTTTTEAGPMFMGGIDLSPFVPEPENRSTGTPGNAPLFTPETPGEQKPPQT